MSVDKAEAVPTTSVEWEEVFVSSPKLTLQQCRRLSEVAHLEPLLRMLPAGSSIIEAGCGLGQFVYAFASLNHRCIGFDFSHKLIARAQRRAADLPELRARTDWVQGTILDLPVGPETLDCHASFGVLEHFTRPQQRAILSEAYRILKPGGILYLFVPNFWSAWTLRRQIRYWFRRIVPPHLVWQRNISKSTLQKMCTEAGFKTELIQSFYAATAFETLALPTFLSRGVPSPMRTTSARLAARLGRWCDDQNIMGYGLVYVGRKAA